jgi:hypothetical protein
LKTSSEEALHFVGKSLHSEAGKAIRLDACWNELICEPILFRSKANIMKLARSVIIVLGCIWLLAGCGFKSFHEPQVIAKKYRIALQQQPQEGKWITKDIQLSYRYHLQHISLLELSSELTFDNYLTTGFSSIEVFSLSILFLGSDGHVIGQKALYVVSGNQPIDQRMRFDRSIELPEGTQAFSFSYSGKVSTGSGRGGGQTTWDFFF